MKSSFISQKIRLQTLLSNNLSRERLLHSHSTAETAVKLAREYGMDEDKMELAALTHDIFRELNDWQLLRLAEIYQYQPIEEEINSPVFLHGVLAARYLYKKWQIEDEEVLQAVEFHTTGCIGLRPLGKALFIADAVEPRRHYELREYFWQEALKDLDSACMLILQDQKLYFDGIGRKLHPLSLLWLQDLQQKFEKQNINRR